jgi:hypothetical protein
MKCPKCKKKMIFDREIKDYYCESCEESLRIIKKELNNNSENDLKDSKDANDANDAEDHGSDKDTEKDEGPPEQPEIGTVRGILFIMIGSLILILNPVLMLVCQLFGVIGLFLLIMGFFLVYKDKPRYSKNHQYYLKFAAILFIIWLIIYIISNIYLILINIELTDEIETYKNATYLPNHVIINHLNNLELIYLLTFPTISLIAIWRYLTIKELIHENLRLILEISVILIVVSALISTYLTMENNNFVISNLEDTTEEEFYRFDFNLTNDESVDFQQISIGILLFNTAAEGIMILCYYWTYRKLKDERIL